MSGLSLSPFTCIVRVMPYGMTDVTQGCAPSIRLNTHAYPLLSIELTIQTGSAQESVISKRNMRPVS